MQKIMCIIFVLLLGGMLSAQEKNKNSNNKTYTFKLGILYINSSTGDRFKQGIEEAVSAYSTEYINVKTEGFPYVNETNGLDRLEAIIKKKEMDIILGPTDSGVFVRAVEKRKKLEQYEIPVISSQVTAKVPHQKGGWFFRTNMNVERRAQIIHDCLNKYWIRSIAVIYEDNEFGRSAEEAFREELEGQQKEFYLPLSYNSIDKARNQIRLILDRRPEAVGIFCNRRDFVDLYKLLKLLNAGSSRYLPQIFSVIDIRTIRRDLQSNLQGDNSVLFVSVTNKFSTDENMTDDNMDDVKSLAYKTTRLILRELDTLAKSKGFKYKNGAWRQSFRTRFEAILNGNIKHIQGGTETRISFKNYENETPPKVFKFIEGDIHPVKLEEAVGFLKKLGHKIKYIRKRFGVWWIFNLCLIFFIVLFLSVKDIRHRYIMEWSGLFKLKNLIYLILPLINIIIALGIYFYLGETGGIRYDSVLAAFILALAPTAILRVTLFETPAGKSIGLAKYYDDFLQWIYEKLTIKNYLRRQAYINLIAYHNSVYGMKRRLMEIYQNASNKEQRIKIQTKMEEVLSDTDSWLERRKALARLLLQKLKWDQLIECNFVPDDFKWRGPDSKNQLTPYDDPENVIQKAARSASQHPSVKAYFKAQIKRELKELKKEAPERAIELEGDHIKDKSKMKTHTVLMRKEIIFLSLLKGYDRDYLEKKCLHPKSKDMLKNAVEYCAKQKEDKEFINKMNEAIEKLIEKKVENEKKGKKGYKKILKRILIATKNTKTSLEKKIRFLLLEGYDEDDLKDNDLLPQVYQFTGDPEESKKVAGNKKGKTKSKTKKNTGAKIPGAKETGKPGP